MPPSSVDARRPEGPLTASAGGIVLAVDGGGTKTDLALIGIDGTLLAHVRGGRSQVYYLGVAGTIQVLQGLLKQAAAVAGLNPHARPLAATAHLLLAGIDVPEEHAAFSAAVAQVNWSEEFVVGNDCDAVLRAGSDRGWGIGVVCGTGINCAGIAPDGREARFLSFGEISGDWGGGGDISTAAVAAAVRAHDRRGPATALQSLLPDHFNLSDPLALAQAFHHGELPQARLAEAAPLTVELYGSDPVATAIVDRNADEIIAFIRATVTRLGLEREDPDVILGGRVNRSAPTPVVSRIAEAVHALCPAAKVAVSPSEPIVGAALLGLDALGASAGAKSRARTQLDAM